MIKFQLVTSLLFLGATCSTFPQFNLTGIQNKLRGSYSAGIIASRITGELYLKGVCLNKYMDDPIVTTIIRDTLVNFEVLTESEADLVQPEHLLLTGRNQYKLKVFDGSSTAWSKAVTLIVESHADITTWYAGDYDFHFIAYFTPKQYLWLRKILLHDPKLSADQWILGCLVQVLDDNDIDTDWENIPWTGSFPKIFRWDNRLEEHMSHFEPWPVSKSEIINMMINCKDIDHLMRKVRACKDIDILILTLRGFLNYQTAEDNFGMMLNIEWNYDTDSNAMSLKSAYIW